MLVTGDGNQEINENDIVVMGIPFDCNSSYKRGPALAPVKIRKALRCESSNMWSENLVDLGAMSGWHIGYDLDFADEKEPLTQIESEIEKLLKRNMHIISLGGDHSITFPIVRAYSRAYPKMSILHLDAHPDLYDELDGNRFSHASPFARIMEENLAERLVPRHCPNPHLHQPLC